MEYLTRYPKTISFRDGLRHSIDVDSKGVEQLHIVVKKSFDELMKIFTTEGFTKVKFEHKQPDQIGNGLNLKLKKPWEMHVRLVDLKKGLIGIHAEVEVSRDYLQHLVSQRTPVVYEVEEILKKYQVDYKIWHDKIKKSVHTIVDNYKVKLATPSIPPQDSVSTRFHHFGICGKIRHRSPAIPLRRCWELIRFKSLCQYQKSPLTTAGGLGPTR